MHRTTRLLAAVTCALAATAWTASAAAAPRLVIKGAGYGHGVGMSQYGTYGFAKRGRDFRSILAHYYTGTELAKLSEDPEVRVLLQRSATSFSGATGASGRRLDPGTTYYVSPTGIGRVALKSSTGRTLKTSESPLRVTGPDPIRLNGRSENGLTSTTYRGRLEFHNSATGFFVVNVLGLEDYVSGVVSAESPASWPAEALKAQAVAARTYAITTGGGAIYDQLADTRSQMYYGVKGEYPSTEAAIDATRGQVVTYDGEPVVTYFFSTSGGRTEDVENSFIGSEPKPWLKSVEDPYDSESPRHRWGPYRYTLTQAAAKLSGYVKGRFRSIRVVKRGRSPRVVYADVVGSGGRTRVTGPTLRARFGLYDTWATFAVIGAKGTTQPPSDATTEEPSAGDGMGGGAGAPARAASGSTSRTITGRVGWVARPTQVVLQQRAAGRWTTLYEVATDRRGRFAVSDLDRGTYRIRWRGAAGDPVTL